GGCACVGPPVGPQPPSLLVADEGQQLGGGGLGGRDLTVGEQDADPQPQGLVQADQVLGLGDQGGGGVGVGQGPGQVATGQPDPAPHHPAGGLHVMGAAQIG